MQEEWRDIPGYEELYVVSNLGRVRRDGPRHGGRGAADRILRPHVIRGYQHITLSKDGVHKSWLMHGLVAHVFIGPKPLGTQVNHKDGNRGNNTPENLEYLTPSENCLHAIHVLKRQSRKGESHPNRKLTDADVIKMRQLRAGGMKTREIATLYGTTTGNTAMITSGRSWGHVLPKSYLEIPGAVPGRKGKLTPEQVNEIHERKARGENTVQIAKTMGVTPSYIGMIINGKILAHQRVSS